MGEGVCAVGELRVADSISGSKVAFAGRPMSMRV
jgi:hypothetical protein